MHSNSIRILPLWVIAFLLAVPASALSQEGHPFDGTWRGTLRAESGETRERVVIMDYNGVEIEGMIDPGPNSIPIESAELDASNWLLQVEAEGIEFEGTLKEIGARDRYMEGTWREDGEEYRFRLTRQ